MEESQRRALPEQPRDAQHRQFVLDNVWMHDVKSKLQRAAAKKQQLLRKTPGFRAEAKVALVFQMHAQQAKAKRDDAMPFSPALAPIKDTRLRPPELLSQKSSVVQPKTKSQRQRLEEKILRRMQEAGYDEIAKLTVIEYVRRNPELVEKQRADIRRRLREEKRNRRADNPVRHHLHVFPTQLSTGQHIARFPRRQLNRSELDLSRTRVGNAPHILEENKTERVATVFDLERVPKIPPRGTLGALLPRLHGPTLHLEFDGGTVAALAANHYELLCSVIREQDAIFGGAVAVERAELNDLVEREHAAATRSAGVASRVECGRASTTPRASPAPAPAAPLFRGVPLLSNEELALLELSANSSSFELQVHDRRGASPTSDRSDNEHDDGAAPVGIVGRVLLDVDSGSESDGGSDYEPLCIVCNARERASPRVRDLRKSSLVADASLRHWRAMHQMSLLDHSRGLEDALERRREATQDVNRSLSSLAKVAHHAERDAAQWRTSRGVTPTPQSIWVGPSRELSEEAAHVEACTVFWRRFTHFLSLLQLPSTDDGVEICEQLRALLVRTKLVVPSLLLRWMHACGPRILATRDSVRFVSYVRIQLGISEGAFLKWCRLQHSRDEDWPLASTVEQ